MRIRPTITRPVNVAIAWGLWALLWAIVSGLVVAGNRKTVTENYREAALDWIAAQPLYEGAGVEFLYLPSAAITFVPFAIVPHVLGEILWRGLTIGVFAVGLRRLASLAARPNGTELFPLMTLVCLPLCWSSARNGQSTLPMAGALMLGIAELADRRWGRAAVGLAVALALKPLALPLILLAGTLYRPMIWPLVAAVGAVLLLPLACQSPDYVLEQYVEFANMLQAASAMGSQGFWAQLFGMLAVFRLDVAAAWHTPIRAAAAVCTLLLAWYAQRRNDQDRGALLLYVLSMCYLMLFNPRTENNTYSALAPALAAMCGQAMLIERRPWLTAMYLAMAGGIVGSYELGRLVTPREQAIWLAPLMTLWFTSVVIWELAGEANECQAHSVLPALRPRALASRITQPLRKAA